MLFEHGNKIIGIVVAAGLGGLGDGSSLSEHLLGFLHFLACDIAVDRHAGACFEQVADLRRAAIALVGKILNGEFPMEIAVNDGKDMTVQVIILRLLRLLDDLREHDRKGLQQCPHCLFILVGGNCQIAQKLVFLTDGQDLLLYAIGTPDTKQFVFALGSHLPLVGKAAPMAVKIRFDRKAERTAVDIIGCQRIHHRASPICPGMDADRQTAVLLQIFQIIDNGLLHNNSLQDFQVFLQTFSAKFIIQ